MEQIRRMLAVQAAFSQMKKEKKENDQHVWNKSN